jgi:hypothetical protein
MIVQKFCTILQILKLGDVGAGEEDAMDLMDRPASGSEEIRAQASCDELVERIARAVREDGTVETLEGCTSLAHPRQRSWGTACPRLPFA